MKEVRRRAAHLREKEEVGVEEDAGRLVKVTECHAPRWYGAGG